MQFQALLSFSFIDRFCIGFVFLFCLIHTGQTWSSYYCAIILLVSMSCLFHGTDTLLQIQNKKTSLFWPKVKLSFIGSNNNLKKEPLKLAVSEIRPGPQSNELTILE